MKKIAIICFGFQRDKARSQPWHMADGLASGLVENGFPVKLFTDTADFPLRNYQIEAIDNLFHRFKPSELLLSALQNYQPDCTFVFIGSHELLMPNRFDLPGEVKLVICNARFKFSELFRITLKGYWDECALLIRPLLSSLLPGWLLKRGYKKTGAADMVYVSAAAQQRYHKLGLPQGFLFKPAVDKGYWRQEKLSVKGVTEDKVICYFGPPLQLRGIDLTVDAFEAAAKKNSAIRLRLLIRLNGEPYALKRYEAILKRVKNSEFENRIELIDKYMAPDELKAELDKVDVFLLPFKVTVSDAPLVIIEAGLAGKPVVALNTPGVEEFVKAFGGVSCLNSRDLGACILTALESKKINRNDEQWVCWSYSVKPIIRGLLHE